MRTIGKIASGFWKVLVGAAFCQFLPTAILVVGWTYRLMQRTALRTWSRSSPLSREEVDALAQSDALFLAHGTWPNWFLRQRGLRHAESRSADRPGLIRRAARNVGASLWTNLRVGFAGIVNTAVATVLPAVLWQVGWYAGWDNSFNKGYEQYYTGIALSWIGILLMLALMFYLPMAQARQAITGEWRAFYDLRTVWRVSTGNPVRTLLLAAAFTLVALPINLLMIIPQGFDNTAAHRAMTDREFLRFLNRYYFAVGAVGFLGYVFVRILAAKWYAGGLLAQLRSRRIDAGDLAGAEKHALSALGLIQAAAPARRHPVIAVTLTVSRPVWRTSVLGAAVLVWFTFIAQIYVREFFHYHPYRGFMNQPLVQLPWLRFVPAELERGVRAAETRE